MGNAAPMNMPFSQFAMIATEKSYSQPDHTAREQWKFVAVKSRFTSYNFSLLSACDGKRVFGIVYGISAVVVLLLVISSYVFNRVLLQNGLNGEDNIER